MSPVKACVHVNSLTLRLIAELDRLKLFTNPVAHFSVLNVHELNGNLVAVSIAVRIDKLAEHPLLFPLDNSTTKWHLNVEFTVHVSLGKAVVSRVEQGEKLVIGEAELLCQAWTILVVFLQVEWVDVRD